MTKQPLISCLCPTYNRRRFIPLLVETFLSQTYPNLELIILDDGIDLIGDRLPPDPRIRYVALDEKLPLGAKWNVCASLAKGEVLQFWSDDDWRHPRLVELLYQHLVASDEKAMLTALRELSYVDLYNGNRWIFRGDDSIADGPAMFYKELWRKGAFYDVEGENSLVGWYDVFHAPNSFVEMDGLRAKDLYLAVRHAANTWRGHFAGDAMWRRDLEPIKLPGFLKGLIGDPEVGVRPPRKDQHRVSFKVTGFGGWDSVLASVLPPRRIARRVARKLIGRDGPYASWDFDDDTGVLIVEVPGGAFEIINRRGDVRSATGVAVPVI